MDASNDLIELFLRLCSEFNSTGIPYCVTGGFAVAMWGPPRGTSDIDIVIMIHKKNRNQVSEFLNNHFNLVQSHENDMVFKNIHIWRHILRSGKGDNIFPLDMIISNNAYLKKVIKRKIEIRYRSVKIPVISLEDLIILKSISQRDIDRFDIGNIFKSGHPIDWEYLKGVVSQLNLDWEFIEKINKGSI